jgi:hypothetical protein
VLSVLALNQVSDLSLVAIGGCAVMKVKLGTVVWEARDKGASGAMSVLELFCGLVSVDV